MRFAGNEWFFWLTLLPLILALGITALVRRLRDRARLSGGLFFRLAPEVSLEREILTMSLVVLAYVALVLSLARPQFGSETRLVKRRGVDVVAAVDVSRSMLARDVGGSGTRLKRAKLEVSGLIDRLEGDRIGLVAFAGAAFPQCPLTSDYAAAKLFLRSMEAGAIPVGGTNFLQALQVAGDLFENARGGSRSRVLVLITDGEDHEGGFEAEVERLAKAGVIIHTVGIGTQIGELVPTDEGGYMRSEGKPVMSRLQEGTLRAIAEATGGIYMHSAAGDLGFDAVVEHISRLQKADYESRLETVYEERFQIPALVALLLLLAATFTPGRRARKPEGTT